MRATISVVLDDGTVLKGTAELSPQAGLRHEKTITEPHKRTVDKSTNTGSLDFELEARPFMKRYGVGLTGPARLVLLIAHFAKGIVNSPVPRNEVVRQWGKMKSLMGGNYNGAYDTRARDANWLRSPKAGVFELLEGWDQAVNLGG